MIGVIKHDLRRLAVVPLQLAADLQVEPLIRAAQLDIGLQRDRIVALRERIEQLVQRDGLFFLEALVELLALQHLRDGEMRGEADDALEAERAQPLGVEADFGLIAIEDAEDLVGVGLRHWRRSVRG